MPFYEVTISAKFWVQADDRDHAKNIAEDMLNDDLVALEIAARPKLEGESAAVIFNDYV